MWYNFLRKNVDKHTEKKNADDNLKNSVNEPSI